MPSTTKTSAFIDWLQSELDKRDWNRQRLAEKAELYPSVIGKIMNSEVGIGVDVARKIAVALGISQIDVFRHAGLIDEDWLDDDQAAREYLRLLAAIKDNDERQAAMDTVETILKRIAQRRKEMRPDEHR